MVPRLEKARLKDKARHACHGGFTLFLKIVMIKVFFLRYELEKLNLVSQNKISSVKRAFFFSFHISTSIMLSLLIEVLLCIVLLTRKAFAFLPCA